MIYVWSDTHFNHTKIIEVCRRPYDSVTAMNEGLVERWNCTVQPTDTIYLLGDFGFGKRDALQVIFDRLQGHKHLIVGNHDLKNPAVLSLGWESVDQLKVLKFEGLRLVVCHYPLESWPSMHHGYLHAHGHCHGSLKRRLAHRFDVGVDTWLWPVSLTLLENLAAQQRFEATDGHDEALAESM